MAEAATLRLSQERETPTQTVRRPRYVYRYAYARAAESRNSGEPGQDYLVVREDSTRLAFALCDGVSQSFLGDLAARLLGDALVDWLWNALPPAESQDEIASELERQLHQLTAEAIAHVRDVTLPPTLAPMLRDVLEQKREIGSETTFVAGLLDTAGDRLVLVWMGDSRLRLWDESGERTRILGESFQTRERWSSRRGPVGQVHVYCASLGEFRALATYSDGLALLDRTAARPPGDRELNGLIADANAAPASDDISFLEISEWPAVSSQRLPAPLDVRVRRSGRQVHATWAAVPGASGYDVQLVGVRMPPWRVADASWDAAAADLPADARALCVRAVGPEQMGRWSDPVELPVVPPHALPAPLDVRVSRTGRQVHATWAAVPGASGYDVQLVGVRMPPWRVADASWDAAAADLPADARALCVRAVGPEQMGRWSDPIELPVSRSGVQLYMLVGFGALAITLCVCVAGARSGVSWRQLYGMVFGGPGGTPTPAVRPTHQPTVEATHTSLPTITPTQIPSPTSTPIITPTATPTPALTPTALLAATTAPTAPAQLQSPPLASVAPADLTPRPAPLQVTSTPVVTAPVPAPEATPALQYRDARRTRHR